jgi:CubicO group peptidase (beta-lactamase class C family)
MAAIDRRAQEFAARDGQPGVSYGVVAGGELVHGGGVGVRFTGGPQPDADTVFRIASMTKSFTATVIMLLRDEGVLRLDDPVRTYVPELAALALPADYGPLTIRQLLTMTGGFPTDDPWGDRQQGLAHAEFARLLADGGVRLAWAPGTRFEYSNLGYAILGRVISAVTGARYEDAVRGLVLRPLGMTRTGFEAAEFGADELARGYRRDGTQWLELTPEPSGAFAPIGGVFSTVRDLSRWVAGFARAFPAGGPAVAGDHPLSRASRREMQLAQVTLTFPDAAGPAVLRFSGQGAVGYGFGLFTEQDPVFGTIIQHSGGYPGYGSQMRWHPATGYGAIVLGNSTYARVGALAGELLAAMLRSARQWTSVPGPQLAQDGTGAPVSAGVPPASGGPWPETLRAVAVVNELLQNWDDAVADRHFAMNMALDRSFALRRADAELLRERIGKFQPDDGRPAECDSPAHCRWWVTGERGTAAVQIKLAPLRQPRVQQLVLAIPPADGSALDAAVGALVATLNEPAPAWPDGLATTLDHAGVLRQLRVARAWAGECRISSILAGDGTTTVTVELTGTSGRASLAVDTDGRTGTLRRAEVTLLSAG